MIRDDLLFFGVAGGAGWKPPTRERAAVFDAMAAPPMCFGIPSSEGPPFVADINTDIFGGLGQGSVEEAMDRFPCALVRSMGLKFVSTILGGALAGEVPGEDLSEFSGVRRGSLMIAFRPDRVGETESLKEEVTLTSRRSTR